MGLIYFIEIWISKDLTLIRIASPARDNFDIFKTRGPAAGRSDYFEKNKLETIIVQQEYKQNIL
jgi:hypothetical protein